MNNFLTGTSNAEYHADRTHLSSSGLKLLLQDPQQFYKEYILGEREEKDSPALAEGSLVHTLILEPEKFFGEYAVYDGARRAGKAYEEFAANNPGKIVVTRAQLMRAERLRDACESDTDAQELLMLGRSEHSMTGKIDGVKVKCRADHIDIVNACIVDIKTTSKPTNDAAFQETIGQFQYDLSAALYCYIAASNVCGAEAKVTDFDFYWIVLSKADYGVSVVKATPDDLRLGFEKVMRAIWIYKTCMATGIWELPSNVKPTGGKMSKTAKTSKGTELPLMPLKGKDYLQVAHRLVWLNDDVPRFNIRTEFLVITDEQTVCRAEVVVCNQIGEAIKVATATKRETKRDFSDHTEKAETGAIGRALAILGFGTQFAIADLDEEARIVDSPMPTKTSSADSNVKPIAKSSKKASNEEF